MRRLAGVSATIALVATVGAPSGSAQVPPQDSATGSGVIFFSPPQFEQVVVDARSGPSGEAPSGSVSYNGCGFNINSRACFQGGPATCLNVTDNRAVFAYDGGDFFPSGGPRVRLRALVEVVDNGSPGAGRDTLQIVRDDLFFGGPPPTQPPDVPITDCPANLPGAGIPLSSDTSPFDFPQDYVVTDAKPLPTSKEQCKNGGWRTYGVFKNQGDCVSFVATGGKNPPGKKTG